MSDTRLAHDVMLSLVGNDFQHMVANTDYDKFTIVGGEKPPKEVFEAKLKELIDAQPLKNLREERNTRLAEVDWVFSGDYKLSPEEHALWVTYRKTLRELPSTTEDPANPTWPEKPSVTSGETKIVNATAEFMRMMNENTKLSSKITALERRSTDQELKLIRLSKLLEK
jgi:hypothetical protein